MNDFKNIKSAGDRSATVRARISIFPSGTEQEDWRCVCKLLKIFANPRRIKLQTGDLLATNELSYIESIKKGTKN